MKRGVGRKQDSYRIFSRVLSALLLLVLFIIPFDTVKAESVSSDEDFIIKDGVLIRYKGSASKVVIPEGVTRIGGAENRGNNGLNYNNMIQTVILPKSLKEIGRYAFNTCTGLSKIVIPEGVTTIERFAFGDCRRLIKIDIPESVSVLEDYAFMDCENLREVSIPENIMGVDVKEVFERTAWLEEKDAKNNVVRVQKGDSLWKIAQMNLGTGIRYKEIMKRNNLTSTVIYVGQELEMPKKTASSSLDFIIEDGVLVGYEGHAWEVEIPEGVTSIGGADLFNNNGLSQNNMIGRVILPNSLKEIRDAAFYKCSGMSWIAIPEGVTTIGKYAFGDCKELTEIDIPESVTTIASRRTFEGTPWLREKETVSDLVIVNDILISAYNAKGKVTVPEGVVKMAADSMAYGAAKTEVYLPESLIEIGEYAFRGCDKLKELRIPKSVKKIGIEAFPHTTTILVYEGSYGYNYAKENNLKYRILDTDPENTEIAGDGESVFVKVQKGDSLWKIAREHLGSGIRYEEIMKLNHLKGTMIFVGQELKVPMK